MMRACPDLGREGGGSEKLHLASQEGKEFLLHYLLPDVFRRVISCCLVSSRLALRSTAGCRRRSNLCTAFPYLPCLFASVPSVKQSVDLSVNAVR